MKVALLIVLVLLGVALLLRSLSSEADPAALGVILPGCTVEPGKANAGGTRFTCPGSEWVGGVDWQGGKYVPGHPKGLNSNFSSGNRQDPGYIVLSPDVGKGVIVGNGEAKPKKLQVLRNPKYGRSEFRIPIWFKRGLIVCDRNGNGCVNVLQALRKRNSR